MERAFAGLQEVHQQMHGPRVLARDLGARHQLYARRVGPLAGGQDTVLAVVVGEGEGRKAGLHGQVDQRFGSVAAVGDGRVGVQVDHLATTLTPPVRLSCSARARMDR